MVLTASSSRYHSSDTGRHGTRDSWTGGFGVVEWPVVYIHCDAWRTARTSSTDICLVRRKKEMTSCNHLLTLFLDWCGNFPNLKNIWNNPLLLPTLFCEVLCASFTSWGSADLHLCTCVIWMPGCHQSQAVTEILPSWFHCTFSALSEWCLFQWQNDAAPLTQSSNWTCLRLSIKA